MRTRESAKKKHCTVFDVICLMIERIEISDSDVEEGSDLEWKDDDDCNYSDLTFVDSFDDWSTFQTIFNPTRSSDHYPRGLFFIVVLSHAKTMTIVSLQECTWLVPSCSHDRSG